MKTNLAVFAVAAALTLAVLYSPPAQAGDEPAFQLTLSADAGVPVICTGALRPKTKYAVQPTVNAYVQVTSIWDGGVPSTTTAVLVSANTLYDTPTTALQTYICAKPSAAGAGTLKGYIFRGTQE